MKKLVIIITALLFCNAVQSQEVSTYRYPSKQGILAKPRAAKITLEEEPDVKSKKGKMPSEHRVPNFSGPVPADRPVFQVKETLIKAEDPRAGSNVQPNAPASCLNYQGLNDSETNVGLMPPDVNGAVGPSNVLVTINNGIKIQRLSDGANQLTTTLASFFSSLTTVGPFDPKTLYDPYENRWIITCPDGFTPTQSRLLLAVSQTANPLGSWYFYAIDVDPANTTWFDYPSIGFNRNWIVISGNMFTPATFSNSAVFVVNKKAAYTGTLTVTRFGVNNVGATIHPAVTYSNTQDTAWLCNDWNGSVGSLRLYNITGTAAAPVMNMPNLFPTVSSTWNSFDQNVNVFGCNNLRAIDARMRSLVWQGGSLWAAHKVGLPTANPTRASTQWFEINPRTGGVLQFGRVDDPTGAEMYFNPSLSVNNNKDVLLGFSRFSNTQNPRASYVYRFSSDPANTMQSIFDYRTSAGMVCTSPTGARWGDYSSTITDPNGTNMWTLQQYVPAANNSGTWWSMVCPPVNCTPSLNITTPSNTPNTKFEVAQTITASSTVSPPSGFVRFDAGQSVTLTPGFLATSVVGAEFFAYIDGCGGLLIAENQITRTEPVYMPEQTVEATVPKTINKVSIYPNPVQDVLYIELPADQTTRNIRILDAQGRQVRQPLYQIRQSAINTAQLAKGTYFVEVQTDKQTYKAKFVKQ